MLLPQDDELPHDEELLPQEDEPLPQDDELPHDDGLLPQDEEPEPHEEWCEESCPWCPWCPWWDEWEDEPSPNVPATYQDVPGNAPVSPPTPDPAEPPTRGPSDGQVRSPRRALPAPADPPGRARFFQARRQALRAGHMSPTTAGSTRTAPTTTSARTMTSPPSRRRPHRLLRGCPPR
ncbi:hypothetical protein ACF1AO_06090 [Streptomyces longwoodensis]|uniref:hypothetical protein n=1 Tax=Streptomyces longwoodensis TaxID=68231 RepID=UPI003700714C